MSKRIVLLTGNELRHQFVRKSFGLAEGLDVVLSVCESNEQSLLYRLQKEQDEVASATDLRMRHARLRELSEQDFFAHYVALTPDYSNYLIVSKGAVNDPGVVKQIVDLNPDILLCYGSSLITGSLLKAFEGKFINVHLGLSPYYRGGATNLWPLINGSPEYIGATFMYIDEGVDTGKVIHQIRAKIHPDDNPHQIGNRLIARMAGVYISLAKNFNSLQDMPQIEPTEKSWYYRRQDFTEDSTRKLYANLDGGLLGQYLDSHEEREKLTPIVVNPVLARV